MFDEWGMDCVEHAFSIGSQDKVIRSSKLEENHGPPKRRQSSGCFNRLAV